MEKIFFKACKEGKLEVVKFLISQGIDVNIKDEKGNTPLYLTQNIDIVKLLVEKGANVNAKNDFGNAPLHIYYIDDNFNNIEVIKYLVSKGAEINVVNNKGYTPLHYHCGVYGRLEIVQFLVAQGADINIKNCNGDTPLDVARNAGNNKVVEFLEKSKKIDQDFSKVLVIFSSSEKYLELQKIIPSILIKIPEKEFLEGKENYNLSKEIVQLFPRKEMIKEFNGFYDFPSFILVPMSVLIDKNEKYRSRNLENLEDSKTIERLIEDYHTHCF